jgi:membrane-bound ClpP family serine protease
MLDIRYPIGGMFVILGLILVVFGLVSPSRIYEVHSLGVNVNLGWGCALVLFGVFMLAMARRARHKARKADR